MPGFLGCLSGWCDLDAELRIWVGSDPTPIKKEFKKDDAVNEIYQILSEAVLADG